MSNIWLAFLTGLTSGGISCMAVQGGLLTSSIAQQKAQSESKKGNVRFVAAFLTAKIISYTILGVLLGFAGSLIVLTPKLQGAFQLVIGFFLIGTAGYLLNIHPIFRYFAIKPPKFAYRLAKSEGKKDSLFTPFIMGSLTVFMPCGVTQAMMAVALATGNPLQSAALMLAFTIGTTPVFFAFGVFAIEMFKRKAFKYLGSALLIIFGLIALNNAMALFGSPHTIKNYYMAAKGLIGNGDQTKPERGISVVNAKGEQEVTINVASNGYSSSVQQIKVGIPVRLTLITNKTGGCVRAFTIPQLNISKVLPATGNTEITFTPTKKGILTFTCSMGMYDGFWEVI